MSKADDHALAAVTAALLKRGKMLHHVSLIFLVAAILLALGKGMRCTLPLGLGLALGIVELWFAFRVALDADLFGRLAGEKLETADMDKALSRLGLIKSEKSGRSMEDRAKGGLRLLKAQTLCLAGQILAFLACFFIR